MSKAFTHTYIYIYITRMNSAYKPRKNNVQICMLYFKGFYARACTNTHTYKYTHTCSAHVCSAAHGTLGSIFNNSLNRKTTVGTHPQGVTLAVRRAPSRYTSAVIAVSVRLASGSPIWGTARESIQQICLCHTTVRADPVHRTNTFPSKA